MSPDGFRPEVERALRFIGENLERPITVAEVASAAHLSPFHFHRVFHAVVGEPIGRYVTRRRLELAALRLAYETDRSITDVALSSGYSSTSNFSKAFHAHFGCSPSQVRSPGSTTSATLGKLTTEYGKSFRPADLATLPPDSDPEARRRAAAEWEARVRYVDSPGLELACLSAPGGYDLRTLEKTWVELIRMGRQLGLCAESVDAWGIAHDSPHLTAAELLRYDACIPCQVEEPLPSPLFRARMTQGRYAVFPYRGPVEGVEAAYRSIYSCWFAASRLAPDDLRPLDHYVGDEPKEGQVDLEIWFKVRPRK